eukprot:scaffold36476_cov252-Amphora_coffeaeformis.AAC.4
MSATQEASASATTRQGASKDGRTRGVRLLHATDRSANATAATTHGVVAAVTTAVSGTKDISLVGEIANGRSTRGGGAARVAGTRRIKRRHDANWRRIGTAKVPMLIVR